MRQLPATADHFLALALLVGLFFSGNAVAEVRFVPGQPSSSPTMRDYPHILIYGTISAADVDKIQDVAPQLENARPSLGFLVYLNSPGGDVLAAIRLGTFLREVKAHTIVDRDDVCNSACIFLLAGGVKRWAAGYAGLGLHRPAFDPALFAKLTAKDAEKLYGDLIVRCRQYLREMGIDDKLLSDMLRVPSQKIWMVDSAYAREVKLYGDDPAYAEWERARDIQKYGPEYVKQMDSLLDCLNSGNSYESCKEALLNFKWVVRHEG